MSTNPQTSVACDIRDLAFADSGKRRTEWAFQSMPVLQLIRKQLIKSQPLAGIRVAACFHVTPETANLLITLRDGGAAPVLCASNSQSTQDDVAATLVRDYGIPVYAIRGESEEAYTTHLLAALDHKPQIVMDDGCALAALLHTRRQDVIEEVIGGTEETATGAAHLRAVEKEGGLRYPVVAVNDAETSRLFDNRCGTGQSTIDGIIRATNILLAGLNVVVAGYGCSGREVAQRARGLGASVIVTEIDPLRAIEAVMDGFRVMSMADAAPLGDLFIVLTGTKSTISRDHLDKIKSGAIVANSDHFHAGIDLAALSTTASSRRAVREFVEEFALRDGRKIYVLSEGRPINLAAGEGHPASVMDVSFANQAQAVEYLVQHHDSLEKRVYAVPVDLDRKIARMKLESMGVKIDRIAPEQERYLASWPQGT